ncbi:MAG: heat-inducible transcriptional repressor HrcA [Chlamydiota bacterium]
MKALNPTKKKSSKKERERLVLMGLIEYYINTGLPVGSNTLKEAGFEGLSSATIRNYFAELEKQGYLKQQHTSGGRVPTEAAFRLYAEEALDATTVTDYQSQRLKALKIEETREIASYMQDSVEELCELTNCAGFVSAPRFDHDFIREIKMMEVDSQRCLFVLITDFGVVQTEVLYVDTKLTAFAIKRVEEYFRWRITGHDKPQNLELEEEELAQRLYNELMVRYVISYSTFTDEDIYRTGFSKLLAYNEFHDAANLANSMAILENKQALRLLLRECSGTGQLRFWIGEDLKTVSALTPQCAVITCPYLINQQPVGAVGLMCPVRIDYKNLFGVIKAFSEAISQTLTDSIYKFKISYRQPTHEMGFLIQQEQKLLEDKRNH